MIKDTITHNRLILLSLLASDPAIADWVCHRSKATQSLRCQLKDMNMVDDKLLGITSGIWGSIATILAGLAAILATWFLAKGGERSTRLGAARYTIAAMENFRAVLQEKLSTYHGEPRLVATILTSDPPGFSQLRQSIGLLGIGPARIFLFVDRLAGELRDARDYPLSRATEEVRFAYNAAGDLLGMARHHLPFKEQKEIKKPEKATRSATKE
jgi:hypothetical protein